MLNKTSAVLISIATASVLMLSGCSIYPKNVDEGAIDYKKAQTKDEAEYSTVQLKLLNKYKESTISKDAIVTKGEPISVHLQQAFIKDFENKVGKTDNPKDKGEIAIVAKVFELSNENDFNFNKDAYKSGRLVFYSTDVAKGQYLNFSALPIYGPITYNGNPVAVELYILELDEQKSYIRKLLHTLANVGKIAYPPASPVLNVLDELGSSLLVRDEDNGNRVEFKYSMVLYPDKGYKKIDQATIEARNYVFIKESNRTIDTNWQDIRLNGETGRLYKCIEKNNLCNKEDKDTSYREDSYLTIQINKGFGDVNLDLMQNTFEDFQKAMQVDNDMLDYKNLKENVNEIVNTVKRTKEFTKVRNLLFELSKTELTKGEKFRFARELLRKLGNAIKNESNDENKTLNSEQINYALDKLAELVKNEPNLAKKIDRQNFKETFDVITQTTKEEVKNLNLEKMSQKTLFHDIIHNISGLKVDINSDK